MKAAGDEALVAAGRLGRKSRKGLLRLRRRQAAAGPSREAYAALGAEPRRRPPVYLETIEARLVLPMVNEAVFCLEEGVVAVARQARSRDDLRHRVPAVSRRAAAATPTPSGSTTSLAWLKELAGRFGSRFLPAESLRAARRVGRAFLPGSARVDVLRRGIPTDPEGRP